MLNAFKQYSTFGPFAEVLGLVEKNDCHMECLEFCYSKLTQLKSTNKYVTKLSLYFSHTADAFDHIQTLFDRKIQNYSPHDDLNWNNHQEIIVFGKILHAMIDHP
jgi:5-methylcytosine-specific restriction endonuclease McrBC GTP-binding regulatory subunit McrB